MSSVLKLWARDVLSQQCFIVYYALLILPQQRTLATADSEPIAGLSENSPALMPTRVIM